MEKFEIHITGSENIVEKLTAYGFKHLTVDLMNQGGYILRTSHMSAIKKEFKNLDEAIKWTEGFSAMLEAEGVTIFRKKIESPFYEHYRNRALYLESHWEHPFINQYNALPLSSVNGRLFNTARIYNPTNFGKFYENYYYKKVEMALYDTYTGEDFDWLSKYTLDDELILCYGVDNE